MHPEFSFSLLLVEDDADLRRMLEIQLKREGFVVHTATRGEEALFFLSRYRPDLVVLDLMLPGMDGFQVLKQLRVDPQTYSLPVLILTARSREEDIVQGLEWGADDYLTKPFSLRELMARVRALLRRSRLFHEERSPILRVGPFTLFPDEGRVFLEGRELLLSPRERDLLAAFLRSPKKILSRDALLDVVWRDREVFPRVVDATVKNLRRKLGRYRETIVTVRGLGYRFDPSKQVGA